MAYSAPHINCLATTTRYWVHACHVEPEAINRQTLLRDKSRSRITLDKSAHREFSSGQTRCCWSECVENVDTSLKRPQHKSHLVCPQCTVANAISSNLPPSDSAGFLAATRVCAAASAIRLEIRRGER